VKPCRELQRDQAVLWGCGTCEVRASRGSAVGFLESSLAAGGGGGFGTAGAQELCNEGSSRPSGSPQQRDSLALVWLC